MKYYSAIKKEGTLAICDIIDVPGDIVLNEISQTQKEKYCMSSLISEI